jgi:hypothetical protein
LKDVNTCQYHQIIWDGYQIYMSVVDESRMTCLVRTLMDLKNTLLKKEEADLRQNNREKKTRCASLMDLSKAARKEGILKIIPTKIDLAKMCEMTINQLVKSLLKKKDQLII